MNHRHTLNGLTPRTVADAEHDPDDFWTDSERATAAAAMEAATR